jgi:hypothetical protein
MTILTADKFVQDFEGLELSIPMADAIKIYKGSIVCYDTSGYANIGADTASFVCAGIALETVDNNIAGHTAGGQNIRVMTGRRFRLVFNGTATQATVGQQVYVHDSGSVDITATNYVGVGQVVFFHSAHDVDVEVPRGGGAPLTSISGLTATAGELNVLHSVAAGTTSASKALVVDSNKALDTLVIATLKLGAGAGTAVTSTAAEINVLHSVTAGTAAASSALVLGASKDVDTIKLDTSLVLASGASATYGATITEVVSTPIVTIAGNHTTSGTYTINCAAVAPAGAFLHILVTESAGTGTVVGTFGTHFKTTGTLTTQSSGTSTISFIGDGTNWNEIGRGATLS